MDKSSPPVDTGTPPAGFFARRAQGWGRIPGNVRGGLWALGAGGFYAVMVTLIKLLGSNLHVTEILLFRQIFIMVAAMPVILRVGFAESFMTERPGLQVVRIFVAVIAMLGGFTAVIYLPLADAITIGFARTFFISIFAILLLGEIVGIRRWGSVVIGFIGVMIVAQPEGLGSFNIYGLMAIVGAGCAGLVMVIIRILSRTDRPVTILAFQAVGIGLLMIPPALYFWKTPTLVELVMLMAVGVLGTLSQTCNIMAFRAGEASAVAPLDYARLVYAVILGVLVFSEWPSTQVFVGAAIIIGAGLYNIMRERKAALAKRAKVERPGDGFGGTLP